MIFLHGSLQNAKIAPRLYLVSPILDNIQRQKEYGLGDYYQWNSDKKIKIGVKWTFKTIP